MGVSVGRWESNGWGGPAHMGGGKVSGRCDVRILCVSPKGGSGKFDSDSFTHTRFHTRHTMSWANTAWVGRAGSWLPSQQGRHQRGMAPRHGTNVQHRKRI